ncbi:MAG: hypothetical protein J6D26_06060 [Clostridia bacterium]|nr:hypothetical protein [Clostridia bacterium]
MDNINLNGKWELKGVSPQGEVINLSADVPGSALNAVLNKIEDIDVFYRDNAELVQKYENYDWTYTKHFSVDNIDSKLELVFGKLDTYCDVYINGKHIAYCDNGFISYRFDITDKVNIGDNVIEVWFYSPVNAVRGRKPRSFCAFSTDRLYTRRMQCTYGWDWTMRFVTCGIGDAYIEPIDPGVRVDTVYVYTKSIDEDCAQIVADINFYDCKQGGIIAVELHDHDGIPVSKNIRYNDEDFMRVSLDVEKPRLWYPNGYGEAYLYRFIIKCDDKEIYSSNIGIRTVKIMQLSDKEGSDNFDKCLELKKTDFSEKYDLNEEFSGFILKVNGIKIMCKGANWVPCEPFDRGDTKDKITTLLELAKNANLNMLRVWGGGAFESEHFYDECSRLGIMVTQDFLMACGDYPEEQEWFLANLRKEAEYGVNLIRNKPCLVWWSGDNENAIWGTNITTDYHGRISAYKGIADVVYTKDYSRDFLPSSPYGGARFASSTVGTTHNTQFLSYLFEYIDNGDMTDFKDKLKQYRARFISEEPVMGAVSTVTLKKIMTDEDIYGDDKSMWLYHTKNNPAMTKQLFDYELTMAEKLFGAFADGDDRLFKLKYLQYEWMRISLERVRREKWFSAGVVYWMYNDCWPAASGWAFIDYYCLPKASYYSFKRAAKPVIGSIDYDGTSYSLCVCNDSCAQKVKLSCFVPGGRVIIPETELDIASNVSLVVFTISERINENEIMILEITDGQGITDRAFYKHGKVILKPCSVDITQITDTGITVSAQRYVHAVELEGEAVFEDNYFSLLPGETRQINYSGNGNISVCGYTV